MSNVLGSFLCPDWATNQLSPKYNLHDMIILGIKYALGYILYFIDFLHVLDCLKLGHMDPFFLWGAETI